MRYDVNVKRLSFLKLNNYNNNKNTLKIKGSKTDRSCLFLSVGQTKRVIFIEMNEFYMIEF